MNLQVKQIFPLYSLYPILKESSKTHRIRKCFDEIIAGTISCNRYARRLKCSVCKRARDKQTGLSEPSGAYQTDIPDVFISERGQTGGFPQSWSLFYVDRANNSLGA